MEQNFPNPFNHSTFIQFELSSPSNVWLKIYDILGREVDVPVNRIMPAGRHQIVFHSKTLAKGTCFYRIEDHPGMQRLVEYISRCPFSLARMVSITKDDDASKSPTGDKVLYRAGKAECIPFPVTCDKDLTSGMPRNYEIYDPLDFLAEATQHIPNKGEHQIRFYGRYSNMKRGMTEKTKKPVASMLPGMPSMENRQRQRKEREIMEYVKQNYLKACYTRKKENSSYGCTGIERSDQGHRHGFMQAICASLE